MKYIYLIILLILVALPILDAKVIYDNSKLPKVKEEVSGSGNVSWNQTLTDSLYLLLNGSNANQDIDIGIYDLKTNWLKFAYGGGYITGSITDSILISPSGTDFISFHNFGGVSSMYSTDLWDLGTFIYKFRNGYYSGIVTAEQFSSTDDINALGTVTAPEYLFNGNHPVKTVWRGDYLLGFQQQDSGYQMTWELWNKDGDGTDNVNLDLWAHGKPEDLTDYELLQVGYITNVNEDLRYYKVSATAAGEGMVYPLKLYTGTNTNQVVLTSDGAVSMSHDLDVVGDLTAGTIQADNGFTGDCVNTSFVGGIAISCND